MIASRSCKLASRSFDIETFSATAGTCAKDFGIKVGGPMRRTLAPSVVSACRALRATRLLAMSPTMAMVAPWNPPSARRMVRQSSKPWVGCSCRPSPALMTAQRTCWANCAGPPERSVRTTMASTPSASTLSAVSRKVSPLLALDPDPCSARLRAPMRAAAASKLRRVRVESSKKRLATSLPARDAGAAASPRAAGMNDSARSRSAVSAGASRPSSCSR